MTRALDVFLQFLKSEQARGVTHVPLDDGARSALRALHERLRGDRPPARVAAVPVEARKPADGRAVSAPAISPGPVPARPVPAVDAGGGTKAERIARLRAQAGDWPPARQLGTLREPLVFSTGDPESRLVLVGEAPGYEEERQGEPFVGPAGRKLDDILKAMGLARADIYITNIVKNRPMMDRQATNNRKPNEAEIAAWLPFVKAELAVVRPRCVVALGATAAEGLLGPGRGVGTLRGAWHEFEGLPVRVTYHPSYLLRSEGNLKPKRELWEDMLEVMSRLELPVSEKQRGYFLPKA